MRASIGPFPEPQKIPWWHSTICAPAAAARSNSS